MVLMLSCKENYEEIPIEDPQVVFNYLPMKTGNYWVYRHYQIDTLGNVTETQRTDSVIISGDSMINDKRYFVFKGTHYPYNPNWGLIDVLRDSIGYIVNANGIIKFSKDNFTDILASKTEIVGGDTIYTLNYQMENPDSIVTLPAGEFSVLNYKGTVRTPMKLKGIPNPRYMNTFYADGVGCVVETYFYLNHPTIYEKRLIWYKAEKE